MESHNSSLLVHIPTFVDKMPVIPKSGTSLMLLCVLTLEMCIHVYALRRYESVQNVRV